MDNKILYFVFLNIYFFSGNCNPMIDKLNQYPFIFYTNFDEKIDDKNNKGFLINLNETDPELYNELVKLFSDSDNQSMDINDRFVLIIIILYAILLIFVFFLLSRYIKKRIIDKRREYNF